MFNFLPRNTKFFDYFDRDTEVLVRAAESFCRFLESSGDPREHSKKLKELEHEADRITHEAMELLHRSFITPLERGDLRRLILALDEIVDYLDDAARRIALYEVGVVLPEVCAMGKLTIDLAKAVEAAVHDLRNLRDKNNNVLKYCIEIQRLENLGDHLHHIALASIFKTGMEPLQVMKWKEIIDLIELSMDASEEVAHVIEGIVLENA
jgi:predicted phosphate transport protein (TIGR00153 family)